MREHGIGRKQIRNFHAVLSCLCSPGRNLPAAVVMVLEAPLMAANARLKMIQGDIECLIGIRSRTVGPHECSRTQVHGAIRAEAKSFLHECYARLGIAI